MSLARHTIHYVPNHDGWELELRQCRPPKKIIKTRNPLAIIPGYGMNSFIFGFHPRGPSLEEYFRRRGFEVWSLNLRGQGGSRLEGDKKSYGMKELALKDLSAAVDFVARKSKSRTGRVDVIGCSLGGSLAYLYAALDLKNRLGSLVAIGAPLRWEKVHPLVRLLFCSPRIAGMIPTRGAKTILRLTFPLLTKSPLLKIYLHKEMVDLRHREFFMQTVEDPVPTINREIADWIKNKDLVVGGKNLTREFRKVKTPLLCVLANADGIVPPMTALSAEEVSGAKIKETLVVGTDKLRFAHADLFVSNHCHEMVFRPIAEWLIKNGQDPVR